jgi:hypothetical protein
MPTKIQPLTKHKAWKALTEHHKQIQDILYSPSPEYPAACSRDERQGEPRRSSTERRRVRATAQFHFDTPQLAAGSFIFIENVF